MKHYKIQIIEETIMLKLQLKTASVIKTVNLVPITNPKAFPFKALVYLHTGVRINQTEQRVCIKKYGVVGSWQHKYVQGAAGLLNKHLLQQSNGNNATGVSVVRGI